MLRRGTGVPSFGASRGAPTGRGVGVAAVRDTAFRARQQHEHSRQPPPAPRGGRSRHHASSPTPGQPVEQGDTVPTAPAAAALSPELEQRIPEELRNTEGLRVKAADGRVGFQLPWFDPTVIPPDAVVAIVGTPGTGKSHMIQHLAHTMADKVDTVFGINFSEHNSGTLRPFCPRGHIFHAWDSARIIALNALQERAVSVAKERAAELGLQHVRDLPPEERTFYRLLYVWDDFTRNKSVLKREEVIDVLFNHRHKYIGLFMGLQRISSLSTDHRPCLDFVLAARGENADEEEWLRKTAFSFLSKKEFPKWYNAATAQPHHFIVIDKKHKKRNPRDQIYEYAAPPQLPASFRVGRPVFYLISEYLKKTIDRARALDVREIAEHAGVELHYGNGVHPPAPKSKQAAGRGKGRAAAAPKPLKPEEVEIMPAAQPAPAPAAQPAPAPAPAPAPDSSRQASGVQRYRGGGDAQTIAEGAQRTARRRDGHERREVATVVEGRRGRPVGYAYHMDNPLHAALVVPEVRAVSPAFFR